MNIDTQRHVSRGYETVGANRRDFFRFLKQVCNKAREIVVFVREMGPNRLLYVWHASRAQHIVINIFRISSHSR